MKINFDTATSKDLEKVLRRAEREVQALPDPDDCTTERARQEADRAVRRAKSIASEINRAVNRLRNAERKVEAFEPWLTYMLEMRSILIKDMDGPEAEVTRRTLNEAFDYLLCQSCGHAFPEPGQVEFQVKGHTLTRNRDLFRQADGYTCPKCGAQDSADERVIRPPGYEVTLLGFGETPTSYQISGGVLAKLQEVGPYHQPLHHESFLRMLHRCRLSDQTREQVLEGVKHLLLVYVDDLEAAA